MDHQRIDDQDMLRIVECAHTGAHELLSEIHDCGRNRGFDRSSTGMKIVFASSTVG
jgi:hypothetical protein